MGTTFTKIPKITMANALRRGYILIVLQNVITSFQTLSNQYCDDEDFGEIWQQCKASKPIEDFYLGTYSKDLNFAIPKHL